MINNGWLGLDCGLPIVETLQLALISGVVVIDIP